MFLSSIKKLPRLPRRNKLFSSLNCNVFLNATFHRDGELVWKDSDLLDKIPHHLLIIGEHLILCFLDGFPQSNNPFFVTLPFRLCGLNLVFSFSELLDLFSKLGCINASILRNLKLLSRRLDFRKIAFLQSRPLKIARSQSPPAEIHQNSLSTVTPEQYSHFFPKEKAASASLFRKTGTAEMA